ncbi:SLBB domain-containing protein [Aquirufa aurantiipilula]|uniref:SLBB domain-containing protein n=1 Tax=Aquirufa aurantiipilula TaxID=2696561 RepID=UPI001CAA66FC|nr:SLBB domain-containing protein [Aquirufa aurantiipilula]MBZ1326318.1 sugar transporter [Aquirufa aurantiipilula]
MKLLEKTRQKFLFVILLLFCFVNHAAFAQTTTQGKKNVEDLTEDQIAAFYQKAQASGMSEAQIEKAAIAQGYTASDIAKMREKINNLTNSSNSKTGNKLEAQENPGKRVTNGKLSKSKKEENKNGIDSKENTSNKDDLNVNKNSNGKKSIEEQIFTTEERIFLAQPLNVYNDSLVKLYKELQLKRSLALEKEIFGSDLFDVESLNFEPDLKIATPSNYLLGPEDELNIDIFGDVLDNFKVKVSTEGTVKILNLSPIYVNGLSIEAASNRIIGRLRQLYQGLNKPGSGSSAQVTLGNVRSIKVTLTGEVKFPGSYTVSSLATVFNALYLAGGPSTNGSYRNIRIIRANKVIRTLDLYDFLLKADQKDNIHLQDQDIIRISDYETRVELIGEVKRPMIFETIKGETLKDVLRFAGGFTNKAYTYSIPVTRNTSRELKLLNITQDEVSSFLPQNGDKYVIGAIIERFENRVEIEGAVFRPGMYALESGVNTVKELIKRAEGTREDAFLNRATITRRQENFEPQIISIDLGRILRGEMADVPLQREDIIKVFTVSSLKEKRTVSVFGEVNQEGEFEFKEGMKVGDLILLAKGFKDGASYSKLELARRVVTHGVGNISDEKIDIKTFNIDGNLQLSDEGNQFTLTPFDILSIRRSPDYEDQRYISIQGMVNYPGVYALKNNNKRISDFADLAGGLKDGAFLEGAQFYRNSEVVGIDLKEIMQNPNSKNNMYLMAMDSLFIPRINQTVKLSGAVQNPISVTYKEKYILDDYISEAGGFASNAIKKLVYVKNPNGISSKTKKFLFFKIYPKVLPGSEIIVEGIPPGAKKGLTTAEVIGLTSSLASFTFTIITLVNQLSK